MELFVWALIGSAVFGFVVAAKTDQMLAACGLGVVAGLLIAMLVSAIDRYLLNDVESIGAIVFAGISGGSLCALVSPTSRFKRFFRRFF